LSVPTARTLFENAFKEKYLQGGIRLDPDIPLLKQINKDPIQSDRFKINYQNKPEKVNLDEEDDMKKKETKSSKKSAMVNFSNSLDEISLKDDNMEEVKKTDFETKETPKLINQEDDTKNFDNKSDSSNENFVRQNTPTIKICMLEAVKESLKEKYLSMLTI